MFHLLQDVFVGSLDAACFRYVLLMCDFITLVTWQNVEDFRAFSSAVYPFLSVSWVFFSYNYHLLLKPCVPDFSCFKLMLIYIEDVFICWAVDGMLICLPDGQRFEFTWRQIWKKKWPWLPSKPNLIWVPKKFMESKDRLPDIDHFTHWKLIGV